MRKVFALSCFFLSTFVMAQPTSGGAEKAETQTGYAAVDGLKMYYEVHGTRDEEKDSVVVLHGAYMNAGLMGDLVAALAETRQVIVPELQGHGRTNDIDRPITYEDMADDVAGLLEHLNTERADVFGYSMGGGTALQLAIRHPERVRKLIVASATYKTEGMYPEVLAGIGEITPEVFAGSPMETEYKQIAPNPEDFPTLVRKLVELDTKEQDWPDADIRNIASPTLLIIGDADVVRPEHAVEMLRLLGGGVPGDFSGMPDARLAVLPGTTHVGVMEQTALLLPMIEAFLESKPSSSNTGSE